MQLLLPGLGPVQFVIEALEVHQLIMLSLLCHHTVSNDADFVGIGDGGQAVSDDDACATFPGLVQCFLNNLQGTSNQ